MRPAMATEPAGRRRGGGYRLLRHRWGGPIADRILRGGAVLGVATLAVTLIVPGAVPLAVFLLFTLWTNGPYSPVLPAAYEPVLMLFGRLYPPLLVAAVGTLGTALVEYLNYHVYAAGADRLPDGVRAHPMLARVERWYARAPFATIVVAALTPIPFWLVRVLSALTRYPVRRHLTGTALGRFPRLWLFAAIAAPLRISTSWLALATLAIAVVIAFLSVGRLVRRRMALRRTTHPATLLSPSPEIACCS